jgi:hypothetical protein
MEQEELLLVLRGNFQILPNSSHASAALPIAEVLSELPKAGKKHYLSGHSATKYSYIVNLR